MKLSAARLQFQREVQQPDDQIDLARAALYLAGEEYPELEPEIYLEALAKMAAVVGDRLPAERYPLKVIQTLNQHLYEELDFRGNAQDYYDPRNSFLNQVIDRRLGIPITLALVYLEVAKRLDFPMVGIGMPGHFLIRPDFPDAGIYVDTFNRGEVLFDADCATLLSEIYQQPVTLQPQFLVPVTRQQFLTRMLVNLKLIYINRNDLQRTLAVVERLLILTPDNPLERRDRGLLHSHLNERPQAIADLEAYLDAYPEARDAAAVRQLLQELRQ
ncbi:MAG: tetratricopeptide repeat protein [Spirulinaceae cyanobacterium SM2_1_0]|nr:tetratricopeptide repeat protein [Spirulinaceae cyanobacterium SM2_1_0]